MIRFSEEEAHIQTSVRKQDLSYRVDMHLKQHKSKGIAINGVSIKKASQLFGIVNIIFFLRRICPLLKVLPRFGVSLWILSYVN